MSLQTNVYSSKLHNYEYQLLAQAKHSLKLFEATDDGVYTATHHEIMFGNTKIAKFDGTIRVLKESGGILVAGDDRGSIKVMKERVLRQYETCSAVVDVEFTEALKIAVICEDNFLRIYEFQEESPIAKMKFDEKLCGVAHKQNILAVLTEYRIVLVDVERLIEIKSFHETGDGGLCFLNERKMAFYCHNKVKVIDTETGDIIEKRVHRCAISKVEVSDGLIYSLGKEGHIKTIDDGLNIIERHVACEVSYFIVKNSIIHVLKDGFEVCVLAKKTGSDEDEASYRMLEGKMKRYEYRGSLLLALERDNMKMISCVLGHLFNVNGLKQALSDYPLDSLASILSVINRSWHWTGHTKIDIEVANVILSDYVQFYTELKPYFDDLARNVTDELLFQQECCIVASFAEEMLYEK